MGSDANVFKAWAINEDVVSGTVLEAFQGKRIGIDAEDYLHALLVSGNREPLLPALGGQPFSLTKRVDQDLENFRAAGMEPIFVFNGLDLACKDRFSIMQQSRKATDVLSEAWQIYDQGKGEDAVTAFGKACTYRDYNITRTLQTYLNNRGILVWTAPYAAAAQLVYLEREGAIDAIQGSASCLAFGADRVVITFDWDKKQVIWLGIDSCCAKLELVNREHFIDICLLTGASILPVFPELEVGEAPRIRAARDLVRGINNNNININTYLHRKSGGAGYLNLFHQAKCAIKFIVVLKTNGEVEPLNWRAGPSDAHEFIGQRLPDEIYFYLSRGVIGPRVLNWRTRMEVLETQPLDGGNSSAYKELVQIKLRPLRVQALALMTKSLNRYYQKHDVNLACWWTEPKIALKIPDQADPIKVAESWHVKVAQMPQSIEGAPETFPLLYAITCLSKDSEAKKTVTSRAAGSGPQLRDPKEIRANIVWRFLHDRGYINADHTLSAWGKALSTAFERRMANGQMSNAAKVEMEEAIFMAFELLRHDVLDKTQKFPMPPYSGAPIRGTENDKANTTLISRVACLGTLQHKAIGYTGPLSRHLLAYQQTTAAVRGALRDLLEMHACNMFLAGAVDRNLKNADYTNVGASLPLGNEPDVGLALVVKSYLDELSQTAGKRTDISTWFAHALDIPGDLEKAWRMWDAINNGVQAAEGSIISGDVKKSFKTADEWLKQKLELPNPSNGTA